MADRATFGAVKRVMCRLPSLAEWNDHASVWLRKGKEGKYQSARQGLKRRR